MEITPKTIVADMLNAYPQLEDTLIELAPVFVKLRNPVLRKTIAKVTTLKQAALVGNIPVADLINKLRSETGQDKLEGPEEAENIMKPAWIADTPVLVYDACKDIEQGEHPLARVMQEVTRISGDEVYLLITPFMPAPLIDKLKDKGYDTYSQPVGLKFNNYIKRRS